MKWVLIVLMWSNYSAGYIETKQIAKYQLYNECKSVADELNKKAGYPRYICGEV